MNFLLSPQYQEQVETLPLLVSALEKQITVAKEGIEEETIQIPTNMEQYASGESSELIDETKTSLPEMPDDLIDDFLSLLNSVDRIQRSEQFDDLLAIVMEEYPYFYSGEKSAEEVASLIQNRATIYISEQFS